MEVEKRAEAAEEYRKSIVIIEKMVADFPSVPDYAVRLGATYCDFGNLARDSGKPADSFEWYAKAIRTLTPIYEREPRLTQSKLYLRNSYWNRASAYVQLQQYSEAIKDWNMTILLSPPAEQPGIRAFRATSKLQAGQVTEAVAEVAELTTPGANATGLATWNADQWYGFACVYAVASGKFADKKEEYAKRSLDLLQQAVNAGYRNGAHMKKDTDLDPLRDREDFKKLMAEWEAKLPPKKQTSQEPKK